MADDGFSLGAPPFLFLVKGGPIPDFYASVQNTLRHVAKVYQAGPEQKGHVAYRQYHFCEKLNTLISEEFRRQMNILAADPYQRFDDPQPGSKGSIQRWQALRADSRKWRQPSGFGSLVQMKLDADAQAERDGVFDRVSESPPPPKPQPEVIEISSGESDDNSRRMLRRPRGVIACKQEKNAGPPPSTNEQRLKKRKRASSLPSLSSIASSESRSSPPTDSSVYDRRSAKTAPGERRQRHQPCHTPPAELGYHALRDLDSSTRFKVMMKRERKMLTPPCEKCKEVGEECFVGVVSRKGARKGHPACIRCAAYAKRCSRCTVNQSASVDEDRKFKP